MKFLKNNSQAFTKIFFAALLIFFLAGCAQTQSNADNSMQVNFTVKFPGSGVPVIEKELSTTSGTNLFDAMQQGGIEMKYKDFSFGKMVTAIGIIEPGPDQYLAIYVDGNYSNSGISDIYPINGTIVEFRLEKISDYGA